MIDLSSLLVGYTGDGDGPAHYVNGVATIDDGDNIGDYLSVTNDGTNTVIHIDRDGTGAAFGSETLVTLTNVNTDLETLLANRQVLDSAKRAAVPRPPPASPDAFLPRSHRIHTTTRRPAPPHRSTLQYPVGRDAASRPMRGHMSKPSPRSVVIS